MLDLEREREFRRAAESRLEENKRVIAEEFARMESSLIECREREGQLQRDFMLLRQERDDALDRASSARLEVEAAEARARSFSRDSIALREEVASWRIRGQVSASVSE